MSVKAFEDHTLTPKTQKERKTESGVSGNTYKPGKKGTVVEFGTSMQVVVGSNPAQTELVSTVMKH